MAERVLGLDRGSPQSQTVQRERHLNIRLSPPQIGHDHHDPLLAAVLSRRRGFRQAGAVYFS